MDPQAKKTVLRSFVYGLYAVGVRRGEEPHAMTVNWLMQVSFEPPMIAVAVENDAQSLPLIREAGAFAISVFPAGGRELAGKLGRHSRNVPDKLAGILHHPGPMSGAPVLDEATGWLECRVTGEMQTGDHVLVLAEVVDAGVQHGGASLTLSETGFRYAG